MGERERKGDTQRGREGENGRERGRQRSTVTVRRGRVVGGGERQTDRQTDRNRERQTEKQTDTETERYYTSFCMMRVRVSSYVRLHSSLWAQVPVGVDVHSPVQLKPSLSSE